MLDEFGAVDRSDHQRRRLRRGTPAQVHGAVEASLQDRTVNLPQLLFRGFIFHANNHAVRVKKILHSRAFAQKLGVGGYAKLHTSIPAIRSEERRVGKEYGTRWARAW